MSETPKTGFLATRLISNLFCFRISNTSINAPNGTLAPLVEENEATDAPNIYTLDAQDQEGANLAPGQAMAAQEGMEGKVVKHVKNMTNYDPFLTSER